MGGLELEELEGRKAGSSSGRKGRGPPSKEREIWILVSFVLRFIWAVRGEWREVAMAVKIRRGGKSLRGLCVG